MYKEQKSKPLNEVIKNVISDMQRLNIFNCAIRIDSIQEAMRARLHIGHENNALTRQLNSNYLLNCYHAALLAVELIHYKAKENGHEVDCYPIRIGNQEDKHFLVWVKQQSQGLTKTTFLVDPWLSRFMETGSDFHPSKMARSFPEKNYLGQDINAIDNDFNMAIERLEKQISQPIDKTFCMQLNLVKEDFINNIRNPKLHQIVEEPCIKQEEMAAAVAIFLNHGSGETPVNSLLFSFFIIVIAVLFVVPCLNLLSSEDDTPASTGFSI